MSTHQANSDRQYHYDIYGTVQVGSNENSPNYDYDQSRFPINAPQWISDQSLGWNNVPIRPSDLIGHSVDTNTTPFDPTREPGMLDPKFTENRSTPVPLNAL